MKLTVKKIWLKNLIKAMIFIALFVACLLLFPYRNSRFGYLFEEGKPWSYGLITAEEDFPIYKTQEQLDEDYEEALKNFYPYFTIDTKVGAAQIKAILQQAESSKLNNKTQQSLSDKLTEIYAKGIISSEAIDKVKDGGAEKITIISNKVARAVKISSLYTPKTAYAYLLTAASSSREENKLREINLNQYLLPNLTYDEETTEKTRESIIASVSLTEGVVQKGEKIIDRGEIIDEQTYQILQSLRLLSEDKEEQKEKTIQSISGTAVLLILFICSLIFYLLVFRSHIIERLKSVSFLAFTILIPVAISCLLTKYTSISIWIVPFAWVPILVRVFYDSRTAFMTHLITILIVSLIVNIQYEFIIIQILVGFAVVFSLKDITLRSQIFQTAGWVFLVYCFAFSAYTLYVYGDYHQLVWKTYLIFFINAMLIVFAYPLIYFYEKLFGLTSSITLVELTNVNSLLMLQFAEKAPGTFQHSLQVSNLATEAAKKIGANTLLVRAGALYHDIGKMVNPQLFTENQIDGQNPLNDLPYEEAAQLIVAHVEEGLKLAQKHKLPQTIQQFIRTHHGDSKVRYFYNKYANEHAGEKIDESLFCYPGPRPKTKETAILMMADAVEARSRSLKTINEDTVRTMVNEMVGTQINDEQLSKTPLSFKDIEDIKDTFVERLTAMYHHRITYPKLKKK